MKLKIINIGTDPEIFIKKGKEIINAVPFVGGGSKDNPLPMQKEGFNFMYDRAAIEWNQPPTLDLNTFKEHIHYAMDYLKSILPNDVDFSKDASVYLSQEEIDKDDRCMAAGCSANYNCYTEDENPAPDTTKYPNLFTCGGHLHIQFESLSISQAMQVIRVLDLFLGVPSVILDTDLHRRELYGKSGESRFNFSDNRLEYRVLSNFWLFDDKLIEWVWENIFDAISFLNRVEDVSHMEGQVRTAIDEGNMSLAYQLSNEFKLLPTTMGKREEIEK